jgi:xanthine dehydrogenase accessory factor
MTVVQTWGSAPRQPGALLAVRDDGAICGSVSGGCIEDDLIAQAKGTITGGIDAKAALPSVVIYGVDKEAAVRFGLPCGGTLRLVHEPVLDVGWIDEVLEHIVAHRLVVRTLDLATRRITFSISSRGQGLVFDGRNLSTVFGPRWRILLIGAGQLSQMVAQLARVLDFEVLVCDPREEYMVSMDFEGVCWMPGMPDDVVHELLPDPHTAIVALSHDPKLDDMALLEALNSAAFYVGALGSRRNQVVRKRRLAEHFDLRAEELGRLHGPVGLDIGARTPAEMAVSIMAEIVQVRNVISPHEGHMLGRVIGSEQATACSL